MKISPERIIEQPRARAAFCVAWLVAGLLFAQEAGAWPDLRIVKSGPAQAAPGDVITYTLSYSNVGPVKSTSVVMKDFLPPNTTALTNTLNGGALSGSTISWSLGSLNSNAKGSRSFQVRINTNAPTPGSITNRSQIFGSEAEETGKTNDNYSTLITTLTNNNHAPITQNDSYTIPEDTTLAVSAPGILANDSDPDGNTLTAILSSSPTNGTLALNANGSFTYAPKTNFNGFDYFTYRANDGKTNSGIATVTICVTPVNDPPVARNDQYSTPEDIALTIAAPGVLANDTDADGDALTAIIASQPGHGQVSLNANGSFTYVPSTNFNGTDSFTYRANDGAANSGIATVTITVTPVNDLPIAQNDAYTVNENSMLAILAPGVLANDSDPDGNALTAILVNGPTNGVLSLNANGSFTYAPKTNYNGADTLTYRANDGVVNSGIAIVNITVLPVNYPPVAQNDLYSTPEDTVLIVSAPGVLLNDSDADNDVLTAVLANPPVNGQLTLRTNGGFTYTPNTNFNGVDTFTYRASDGITNSGIATVTITVIGVNDPPVARNDQYSTPEDTALVISAPGVLINDTDPDSDVLTANLIASPTHGNLTLNPNGSFTYLPNTNFSGVDTFTYRANDGLTNSGVATVTITVTGVNDPPVAGNDQYSTPEDTALVISAPGVLGNDGDLDGDALTAILSSNPAHGMLTLNASGGFTYMPNTNYNGPDTFTYRASDGKTNSNLATVVITVLPLNDPPVALNDAYPTGEDTPLVIAAPGVLANDSDPDGDTLTTILASSPAHGTLTLSANGGFSYIPNTNYNGVDSFTYRANDGITNSGIATVTITVAGINDPPIAQDDQYTTDANSPLIVSAPGVLANDSDADGDIITAILATPPVNGQVTLSSNGGFNYTPNTNFAGLDTFTYRANDGQTSSAPATVSIQVNSLPPPPPPDTNNWSGKSFTLYEDTVLNVAPPGVLRGIIDAHGLLLKAALLHAITNGTLSLNLDGGFTLTPRPNFNGIDLFSFIVSDDFSNSVALNVDITVIPVNDPPSFVKGGNFRLPQNAGPQVITNWATSISPGPADESGQLITFLVSNNNNALFVVPPSIGSDGTLTFTPASGASGSITVTVTARDDGGTANGGVDTSAPQTFSINLNTPPTVQIVSPTNGASFFVPASFTVLANAQDVDGIVTDVQFFLGTNSLVAVKNEPFFTVLTNLPVGSYTLGAVATDDFGATGSAVPVTVNVIERPPLTALTSVYYNPQTDLFEQRVRITNPTDSTLDAVRVLAFNLTNTPPITVGNLTGYTNGVPYVQTHIVVPPGSYVDLTIEFLSPMRIKPNPILQAQLVSPAVPPTPSQGSFQHINRGLLFANRTYLVEFATYSNRVYVVQYSSDLMHWQDARPAIAGDGNWVQWIDNGEPKTAGSPASSPQRFYRLLVLP